MERFVQELWQRRREGWLARLLLSPLWLLSLAFGAVAALRRAWYRRPGRARRVAARVVSVGNLAVGGAGKTPVAILLANRLRAMGRTPAVLSRGHGRRGRGDLLVHAPGRPLADAALAGDEPVLVARACPWAVVLVGRDRAALAERAVRDHGCDALVLDDGFQHLRLARDLEVVVLDASNPFGNGHLLPRGPLREPIDGLRRAHLAWLTRVDQADPAEVELLAGLAERLTGRAPVRSVYRVVDVTDLSGRGLGPLALDGARCLMAAGIARPGSFRRTLESAGAVIVGEALFPDHHRFRPADLARIAAAARDAEASLVVVTEKDAVRLPADPVGPPWRVLRVEAVVVAGEASLAEVL